MVLDKPQKWVYDIERREAMLSTEQVNKIIWWLRGFRWWPQVFARLVELEKGGM